MPRILRDVAVLGVASVADRNRTHAARDEPIDQDGREKDGSEPDPAEPIAHEDGEKQRERQDQTAETLIEITLNEEGPVAAERASLDAPPLLRSLHADRVRSAASGTLEVAGFPLRVIAAPETTRAVVTDAHRQAGKPVATVRYEERSSPISTKTTAT